MWGLRELPLPDPLPWTPETYGWGVIALGVICLLLSIALRQYRKWEDQAYRREALAELAVMERNRLLLSTLPHVLRRTALQAFPREEVAALDGSEWIEWLNAAGADFESSDIEPLDRLAYQPDLADRLDDNSARHLISASRAFVRSHRARV